MISECFWSGTEQHLRNWEVPWYQGSCNPDWLAYSKYSPPGHRRSRNSAENPLGLAGKPPQEAQRIIQLTLRLSDGLTSLVCNDLGQIISVLSDQVLPFKKPLSAGSWIDLFITLESGVGSLDRSIDVFSFIVRRRCPDFTTARI